MDPIFTEPQGSYQPQRTNGKSIAALVLGILAIVVPYIGLIFGIIAIVFAKMSLTEIKQRNEQGRGMAIAGLVCGIAGTVVYFLLTVLSIISIIAISRLNIPMNA
jgi:uncharacterized protein YacL